MSVVSQLICPFCQNNNTLKYFYSMMPNILSACPENLMKNTKVYPFQARLCLDCCLGFNSSKLEKNKLQYIYDNYITISPSNIFYGSFILYWFY